MALLRLLFLSSLFLSLTSACSPTNPSNNGNTGTTRPTTSANFKIDVYRPSTRWSFNGTVTGRQKATTQVEVLTEIESEINELIFEILDENHLPTDAVTAKVTNFSPQLQGAIGDDGECPAEGGFINAEFTIRSRCSIAGAISDIEKTTVTGTFSAAGPVTPTQWKDLGSALRGRLLEFGTFAETVTVTGV